MSPRAATCRVLVLASVGALACACTSPVATGLEEVDANRVVVALDRAGIDATKTADEQAEGRFRVEVPRDEAARALATMGAEELPRARARAAGDAKGALVPSQAAEHARIVQGLASELERTLEAVTGVLVARVHLSVPEESPLRDGPPAKATASVLVEHRGTTPPLAEAAVQRLVAGGAPGLSPENVSVVLLARPAHAVDARAELSHVGPFAVTRAGALLLKGALAGLVLAVLALTAATLALWTRLARMRRDAEAARLAALTAGPRSGLATASMPGSIRPSGYTPDPRPGPGAHP